MRRYTNALQCAKLGGKVKIHYSAECECLNFILSTEGFAYF